MARRFELFDMQDPDANRLPVWAGTLVEFLDDNPDMGARGLRTRQGQSGTAYRIDGGFLLVPVTE